MADTVQITPPAAVVAPVQVAHPVGFGRIFDALQNSPYYRTYWFGNQASLLVMQMQGVAIGYLAFTLTNSAAKLGLVNMAVGAPMLLMSPFGGVIADRFPKRQIVLTIQAVLCLVALSLGTLTLLGLIQWWHLMIGSFVEGVCFSINMPARQSWIPSLVRDSELPNAIALNNAGMNAARIVGPALGGILIGLPGIGAKGVFYLALPAVAWVFYSLLQVPIHGNPDKKKRASFFTEFKVGFRYVAKSEILAPLFMMALVVLLLGMSYQMLMPAFALGVFDVGSTGLGLMSAVIGAGALSGSLMMAYLSRSEKKGQIQTVAGISLGVGILLFGVASGLHAFIPALVILFFVGVATDFYSTINNTLILLNTDRALFGRVMSLYMMTWSLAPLAAAPFGTAVDHFGGAATMIAIGSVLTIFVVVMVKFTPGFKRLNASGG